jgi:hypothetical protein
MTTKHQELPPVKSFEDEHEAFAARFEFVFGLLFIPYLNCLVEQHNLFMFQIKIYSFLH